jgi:hypothetical protein
MGTALVVLRSEVEGPGRQLRLRMALQSQENAYFFRGFFLLRCFSTPFSLIDSRASLALNG